MTDACWLETPLGPMVAGAVEEGVCLLEFTDRRKLDAQLETVRRRFGRTLVPEDHPHLRPPTAEGLHLARLREELRGYFAGDLRAFTVPLVRSGTVFEEQVWDELLQIPYGETRAYIDLAQRLGRPDAQRAVGRANGLNRIAIVVPCHRVVNKDGHLGGYGGGLWRKRWLLDLERGARSLFPERPSGESRSARGRSSQAEGQPLGKVPAETPGQAASAEERMVPPQERVKIVGDGDGTAHGARRTSREGRAHRR